MMPLPIEPTENESKAVVDRFAEVMATILQEAKETPDLVTGAPHTQPVRRLDEVRAARELDVAWKGDAA